ncbi:hypothetical protein ACFYXH_40890 [Streptomyces sp. NPDC002730]|uniref:hypothetical protein n=1 Tax=Streptomyces sp. NPDC002730 TaxID=3364662 RepID=UPI0036913EB9
MSTAAEAPGREVQEQLIGRCYTKARRHPLVIGQLPGGGRLWGGPYTVPQAIVMVLSFAVLLLFRQAWAHFGLLLNVIVAFAVPYCLGLVVRRVHVDGRNPLAVAGSAMGLLAAPSGGRMGGRPLKKLGRHSPVRGVCTLTWHGPAGTAARTMRPAATVRQAEFRGVTAVQPAPARRITTAVADCGAQQASRAARPQVLSGVGALLAARDAVGAPAPRRAGERDAGDHLGRTAQRHVGHEGGGVRAAGRSAVQREHGGGVK